MSNVSELIGEVVAGKLQINRIIEDECFYTVLVKFHGTVIPVLFSQYVRFDDFEKGSKVKVIGCLMSDVVEGQLPIFYIYANSIESVDIDMETTNRINFSCKVTKVREFKTNSRCIDILPLVACYGSPLNSTSVLYLTAYSGIARKLKDVVSGYTINGVGYLKAFRDIYEIYITDIENLDQIVS